MICMQLMKTGEGTAPSLFSGAGMGLLQDHVKLPQEQEPLLLLLQLAIFIYVWHFYLPVANTSELRNKANYFWS